MKNAITILLLLLSSICFSQTVDDTIQWIGRNSDGKEQVYYDKDELKILFLSVRDMGQQVIFVNEVSIYDVKSISNEKGSDGYNIISINLSSSGSEVTYYTTDSQFNVLDEVNSIKKNAHSISIKSDKELIESFKKAYLHLFNSVGASVKDGNMF